MITLLFIVIFLLLLIPLIIFYKLWWIPVRVQHILKSQGIKGPPYEFIHGNTKEITKMMMQTSGTNASMEISHDMFSKLLPHYYYWIKIYGNVFVYWDGTKPNIVVTEPELIKEILNNKEGVFPRFKRDAYLQKLSGNGILASEGEKWSKLRKISNHAFHGECLKDMVPAMVDSVETMLQRWRNYQGKEIEVCEEFRLMTSEVISRTAFGSSYLEGIHIFDMLRKLTVLISRNVNKIRFFGIKKLWRTQDDIEADEVDKLLNDSVVDIIKKREDEVRSGRANTFGTDFLGSLLEAHHNSNLDQKKQISVVEIIDECKTFYFAGQETTSRLLSWSIFLLSVYTDWQDKARTEVLQLFGQQNPTSEGVSRLKTVSMIIYETLRLYTPVSSLLRRIDCRVRLGKYHLPANVNLLIPSLAMHQNPNIWGEDVHLFKPERFAQGLSKATNDINSMAFLPFGFGPRTCVGTNFASTEAKIALAMILQRYKFTLSPNYVHSPCMVLTTQPKHGIQIMLQSL